MRLYPPRCTTKTASPHPDAPRLPPIPTPMHHAYRRSPPRCTTKTASSRPDDPSPTAASHPDGPPHRARNKRAVVDHDGSPSIERGRPPILNAQCSIHNSDAPAERQPQAQAKREPRGWKREASYTERQPQAQAKREPRGWKREANYPASITASPRCRPAAARGAARRGGDPPRPQGCPWSSPPTS
jgi:hypothetical protein